MNLETLSNGIHASVYNCSDNLLLCVELIGGALFIWEMFLVHNCTTICTTKREREREREIWDVINDVMKRDGHKKCCTNYCMCITSLFIYFLFFAVQNRSYVFRR